MAVAFKFNSNVREVNARMSRMVVKQMPFATAKSLTLTSKTLVEQNKRDMGQVFDRPTRWTLGAFFFIPAKKNNPRTIIKRKDQINGSNVPPSKQNYLEAQQQGGIRKPKAFESALRTRVKGANRFNYATPTKDARLNKSGNMTVNQIGKILTQASQRGGKFFVPKSTHPLAQRGGDGVFERMARGKVKKRLHLHSTAPSYTKRLNFYSRMTRYGKQAFPAIFRRELRSALRLSGFR